MTDMKAARMASAALREWIVKAVAEWGEDPPEPWDWNDVPLINHMALELHTIGWALWPDEIRPRWKSPIEEHPGNRVDQEAFPTVGEATSAPAATATPTPLMLLGRTLDEINKLEGALDALSIGRVKHRDQVFGEASTARQKAYLAALDAATISRARELPDLLPQLGSAFDRIDALLGTREGSVIGEDLKAVRYALASALVVLEETIPAADRCCKHLVDAAHVRGFDLGQSV